MYHLNLGMGQAKTRPYFKNAQIRLGGLLPTNPIIFQLPRVPVLVPSEFACS